MANHNTTITAKDPSALSTLNQVESIIPRVTADLRADLRGSADSTCKSIVSIARTTVRDVDRRLRDFAYREDAAQLLKHGSIAEAEGMVAITVDSATKPLREHAAQLEAELADVPAINEFRATEIRQLVRGMDRREADTLVSRSHDPEVAAAVLHGPRSFPIASSDAMQRMLSGYNKTHRPQQTALLDDARTFVSAVEGFADTVKRELRRVLR